MLLTRMRTSPLQVQLSTLTDTDLVGYVAYASAGSELMHVVKLQQVEIEGVVHPRATMNCDCGYARVCVAVCVCENVFMCVLHINA